MLGLTLKGLAFVSRRLDHAAGENGAPAYLALNPKGQVPTLRHDTLVIRESIAILAYLDRAWPERPLFGETPAAAAAIWQAVMEFESDLRPCVTCIARTLLRGAEPHGDKLYEAVREFLTALDRLEADLASRAFLSGDRPSAADSWLYPSLGWIDRAVANTVLAVPPELASCLADRPNLAAWRRRLRAEPGVDATYPPHWAEAPTS
jgi:glutathione S-transferase